MSEGIEPDGGFIDLGEGPQATPNSKVSEILRRAKYTYCGSPEIIGQVEENDRKPYWTHPITYPRPGALESLERKQGLRMTSTVKQFAASRCALNVTPSVTLGIMAPDFASVKLGNSQKKV